MATSLPKLLFADSESSADILYATRFFAPDPFLYLQKNGKSWVILSDLEVDRGRKQAEVNTVLSYSDLEKKTPVRAKTKPSLAKVYAHFLNQQKVSRVEVPHDFPLGLATELKKLGVTCVPTTTLFWPERELKSAAEIKNISQALRITEAGMARGIEVLRAAKIGKNKALRWGNAALTSEILRAEIDIAMLRKGGMPANTIVAGGSQACDPHERGSGPLKANSLIILDLFPRDSRTGYFGDMTRTVVRGRASDAQRHLWETCLIGQKLAFACIKPGADGALVHQGVKDLFTKVGYPTVRKKGRWQGFFHGTGHGLGLEIHEQPRFGATVFKPGQVITVEPGIYIPGVGGVRHEDVVVVTDKRHQVLSRFPKPLEI
ncbi:MAG: Xaa-Pro peptidase family protein [Chthoniobacterales bacterium]